MNVGPVPVKVSGRGNTSSTRSWASTPMPAATSPTSGTFRTRSGSTASFDDGSYRTLMALGLVGSRSRKPSRWSTARWVCTVADEVRPTASPQADGNEIEHFLSLAAQGLRHAGLPRVGPPGPRGGALANRCLPSDVTRPKR